MQDTEFRREFLLKRSGSLKRLQEIWQYIAVIAAQMVGDRYFADCRFAP